MKLAFTKMHGLGNDFIIIDLRKKGVPALARRLKGLGTRRFGIGFDQAIVLKTSRRADFKMEIYNSDGSQVEMCGNGIRCLADYIWKRRLSKKNVLEIETLAGIIRPRRASGGLVTVDMGEPTLDGPLIPVKIKGEVISKPVKVLDKRLKITCVSMGNPHCIVFVKNVDRFNVEKYGSVLEKMAIFPQRINVEFVEVLSKTRLKMRVWERGAGETLACGTGASATAVAANLNGLSTRSVAVKLLGGVLKIKWDRSDNRVYMTGPSKEVFSGSIEL